MPGHVVVAPFVGAWIEIESLTQFRRRFKVAPFVGAWIEINTIIGRAVLTAVAPFVGAWIEICVYTIHHT